MLVQEVLAKKGGTVRSIAPDAPISDAAKELHRQRIGALMVKDDAGKVIGILSERDIVRELGDRGSKALGFTVADLMTTKVLSCAPTDTVEDVLFIMVRNHIRHLPVIDRGNLIGLLSVRDVMAERLDQQNSEVTSLLHLTRCSPHTPMVGGGSGTFR